jgi:hypothetical protein
MNASALCFRNGYSQQSSVPALALPLLPFPLSLFSHIIDRTPMMNPEGSQNSDDVLTIFPCLTYRPIPFCPILLLPQSMHRSFVPCDPIAPKMQVVKTPNNPIFTMKTVVSYKFSFVSSAGIPDHHSAGRNCFRYVVAAH